MVRVDVLLWAATLAITPGCLRAQSTPLVLTVDGSVTATDNGALNAPGQERSDLITSIRPKVVMSRRGGGFDFDLRVAPTLLLYANGTQPNGFLPDARASLKATVVERLLYVDAAAQLSQSEEDPFG